MIYLDANFFLFASLDTTHKGENARKIQDSVIKGKRNAVTSALAMDEIMWVLIRNNKKHIMKTIVEGIYSIPNLEVISVSPTVPLLAVELIENYHLLPRDAFHAASMRELKITDIVSDDVDFDQVEWIKRIPIKSLS